MADGATPEPHPNGAFSGVRVIDATAGIGGAYAAMILADHGADVIKIEPPAGDPARGTPAFQVLNRGRQSVVLELRSDAGRDELRRLIACADVFLYDWRPADCAGLGLDVAPKAAHPSLVIGYLPAYGSKGPHADLPPDELLVQAVSGVCEAQFRYDAPPVFVNIPIAGYAQGIVAANAVAATLYARSRSGLGDRFELSAVAAIFAMQTGAYILGENVQRMAGTRDPHGPIPTYRLVRGTDDWLFAGALTPGFWASMAVAIGLEECLVDPRFAGAPLAVADADARAELARRVDAAFATRSRDEWLQILEEAGVPRAPVLSREEYARDEQVAHNEMMIELDDPPLGPVRQMNVPVWLRHTPGHVRGPAPSLDEHSRMADWEHAGSSSAQQRAGNAAVRGGPPLDGVRVLDLSGFIAGANGGMLLADMGADVIKVESPDGDGWRTSGLGFLGANRGKRGIVIDLKRAEGRDLLLEMVERADVLMDNYRAGVMDRLGIGWDVLKARNPRLIHCSVTGYGPTGPYAHLPGFDPLFQARSGLMRAQGDPAGEPVYLQLSLVDYATAINAAFGVVAALNARERTGRGQRVETCLLNNAFTVQAGEFVFYDGRPADPTGGRDLRGRHALYRMYEAADASLAIACTTLEHAVGLADVLDLRLPAESDLLDLPLHGEFAAAVAGCIAARDRAHLLALLRAVDVPAAPCLRVEDLFEDEHIAANNLWFDTEHPRWGRIRQTGAAIAWHAQPMRLTRRAPLLGEHTSEVLREFGIEDARVRRLLAAAVVV